MTSLPQICVFFLGKSDTLCKVAIMDTVEFLGVLADYFGYLLIL